MQNNLLKIFPEHIKFLPEENVVKDFIEYIGKFDRVDRVFLYNIGKNSVYSFLSSFGQKINVIPDKKTVTASIVYNPKTNFYDVRINPVWFLYNTYENTEVPIQYGILVTTSFLIHEGLHAAYTGREFLSDVNGKILELIGKEYANNNFFFRIFNVIEDTYIENKCFYEQPYLYRYIELLRNNVMTTNVFYDRVVEAYNEKQNIETFLDMVYLMTNKEYRQQSYHDEFQWYLDDLKNDVFSSDSVVDRLLFAKKVYDYFKENYEEEFEKKKLEEPSQSEFVNNLTEEEIEDLEKHIEDLITRNMSEISKIEQQLNKLNNIDEQKQKVEDPVLLNEGVKRVKFVDLGNKFFAGDYKPIFPDNTRGLNKELEEKFRDSLSFNQPRNSGYFSPHLTPRIFQNNSAIFLRKPHEEVKTKPYVTLLLDISGSTRGGGVFENIMCNAYWVMKSLYGSIPFAAFAHTTMHYNGENAALIYKIGSYNGYLHNKHKTTTTKNYSKRLNTLKSAENNGNADGTVIKYLVDNNTNSDLNNYFIVVSDGLPADSFDGRKSAEQELKEAIDNARRLKYTVLSFSVVESVIDNNKRLYGSKYSVNAVGENFIKNFRRVMQNV